VAVGQLANLPVEVLPSAPVIESDTTWLLGSCTSGWEVLLHLCVCCNEDAVEAIQHMLTLKMLTRSVYGSLGWITHTAKLQPMPCCSLLEPSNIHGVSHGAVLPLPSARGAKGANAM
jgi:hypothetical protein